MCKALFSGIFVLVSATSIAAETEFSSLKKCFAQNVALLEPHQDNMLDLAEIVFTTTCETEKKSFFNSRKPRDQENMDFHFSMTKIMVQQMVVKARAARLGLDIK